MLLDLPTEIVFMNHLLLPHSSCDRCVDLSLYNQIYQVLQIRCYVSPCWQKKEMLVQRNLNAEALLLLFMQPLHYVNNICLIIPATFTVKLLRLIIHTHIINMYALVRWQRSVLLKHQKHDLVICEKKMFSNFHHKINNNWHIWISNV